MKILEYDNDYLYESLAEMHSDAELRAAIEGDEDFYAEFETGYNINYGTIVRENEELRISACRAPFLEYVVQDTYNDLVGLHNPDYDLELIGDAVWTLANSLGIHNDNYELTATIPDAHDFDAVIAILSDLEDQVTMKWNKAQEDIERVLRATLALYKTAKELAEPVGSYAETGC